MGQESTPLNPTRFYRQPDAPPTASDGAVWVTNADGAGSDTSSRYTYNADAAAWELDSAVGPSEPTLGTPVPGAVWRDTANGTATQYDGSSFVNLGVTDHANLDNITSSDHHTRPTNTDFNSKTVTRSGTIPAPPFDQDSNGYPVPIGAYVESIDLYNGYSASPESFTLYTADGEQVTSTIPELSVSTISVNEYLFSVIMNRTEDEIRGMDIRTVANHDHGI